MKVQLKKAVRWTLRTILYNEFVFLKVFTALQKKSCSTDKDVAEFNSQGVSIFNNFLTSQESTDTISEAEKLLKDYDKVVERATADDWCIVDDSGVQFWTSTVTKDISYFGRRRAFLVPGSKPFDDLLAKMGNKHSQLVEFGRQAYGVNVRLSGILVEKLSPSIVADYWHIDSASEAFKAMILLSGVTIDNGPLRYKLKTHHTGSFVKKKTLHEIFKYGLDFAYPPAPILDKSEQATWYGVGEVGDCIMFNTLGFHSGTRCLAGERLAIVLYFDVHSKLNKLLDLAAG